MGVLFPLKWLHQWQNYLKQIFNLNFLESPIPVEILKVAFIEESPREKIDWQCQLPTDRPLKSRSKMETIRSTTDDLLLYW